MTPSEREPTAESRTGMTPMDTTREALWADVLEWADGVHGYREKIRYDVQALIDFEVKQSGSAQAVESIFDAGRAAGVAEVERRYAALVEAGHRIRTTYTVRDFDGRAEGYIEIPLAVLNPLLAALASIDGAPR